MTNSQMRMLVASIGLLAGAVVAQADALNINLSIVMILIFGAMLIGEWWRSFRA